MFKTLLKQIGDYRKDAILTPVFVILEVVMEVIIPLMMAGLALFFGVESGKTASSASSGFAMNLRQAMYEKIQIFSFSNIDKFSTAGLVTRMTTDVMNVQQAFQMSICICVRAPIMLVSAMVMTFLIHPRFALIFLVVIIVLAAVLALHPVDFMDGSKNDHCGESDRRAAYEYVYIRYQYPNQSDDGIHDLCDAHYVKGIGGTDYRGSGGRTGFI